MKLPKTDNDEGSVMESQRLKQAVRVPIPQLRPPHTDNPESRPDFALKSQIPSFK